MEPATICSECEVINAFHGAARISDWDAAITIIHQNQEHFTNSIHGNIFEACDKKFMAKVICAVIEKNYHADVDILIKHGCDINEGITVAYRHYTKSPSFQAAQQGYTTIVKLLLDAGCEKNALNNTGSTALYEAFFHNHIEVVQLLIDYGCDPNIPDVYGNTPLHVVPFAPCPPQQLEQGVQILLEGGADISIQCHSGQTPADIAIQYKFSPLLDWFMNNCQKLHIKTIPHSQDALTDRILPEYLLSPLNTDGVTTVARILVQLHPCHNLNPHTLQEFVRVCEMEQFEDFYMEAKKFRKLMIISGIPDIPNKSPLTLQDSCRIQIRRHFGLECWYRLEHLPLPQGLIDFLQLRNEIHHYAPS